MWGGCDTRVVKIEIKLIFYRITSSQSIVVEEPYYLNNFCRETAV